MASLERTLSGFFHRETSKTSLVSQPSRMSMDEKRSIKEKEWCSKGMAAETKNKTPLTEGMAGFARGAAMAYTVKSLLALVFAALSFSKQRKKLSVAEILLEAVGRDTLRFSLFYGTWSGIFRSVNLFLYQRRKVDDQLNAFIAGAVAGLALLIDDVERRRGIAIWIAVRAASVAVKALAREEKIPYWKHAESALFGLVNGPIMYAFLLEPDIMDQGYYKWILNMGSVTHEGLDITLRQRRDALAKTGAVLPFHTCQPHYHSGTCLGHCSSDWVYGLGRAAKIYTPVHLVPLLLFKYRQLMKDPVPQLLETAKGILLSCMFLSSYVFLVKYSQCVMRNARQTDTPLQAIIGGLLTGFACLFERTSRVSELMLYCVPKSLDVVWNYLAKHHGFRALPLFELPIFMLGCGILTSSLKQDLKTTYFNVVKFLVGTLNWTGGGARGGKAADAAASSSKSAKREKEEPVEEEEEE